MRFIGCNKAIIELFTENTNQLENFHEILSSQSNDESELTSHMESGSSKLETSTVERVKEGEKSISINEVDTSSVTSVDKDQRGRKFVKLLNHEL